MTGNGWHVNLEISRIVILLLGITKSSIPMVNQRL